MVFPVIVMYGCESWDYKESWVLKNWCFWTVVLKTLKSPLDSKGIQPVSPKGNQSWIFIGRTDTEAETPILWPHDVKNWFIWRPWCWERLKAGEGDDRRWDGWMASLTQWTWVWVNSRRWWWTGKSGMLQSMGLQRVRHDWATELNWTSQTSLPMLSTLVNSITVNWLLIILHLLLLSLQAILRIYPLPPPSRILSFLFYYGSSPEEVSIWSCMLTIFSGRGFNILIIKFQFQYCFVSWQCVAFSCLFYNFLFKILRQRCWGREFYAWKWARLSFCWDFCVGIWINLVRN